MQLKIEYLPVDTIKTYENNAKVHTPEQVEQIKNSIKEFGMNDPIAVWKDNVIIEGHGRLIACKELGMDTVPVIRLDSLTDAQRKAYGIAHNKLTMNTGFDLDILSLELEDIGDFDMTDFGFNEAEILELTIDDSPEEIPTAAEVMQAREAVRPDVPAPGVQIPIPSVSPYAGEVPQAPYEGPDVVAPQVTKDDLDFYAQKAEQTVTRRVIIVYSSDEEEAYLKALLRQDADRPLGVVFDVKNIMRAQTEQERADNEETAG